MRFVVLGGGCYGTFYTRQLLRAADSGAIPQPEIVVVDHNAAPQVREHSSDVRVRIVRSEWDDFFDEYMGSVDVACEDQIVPPPFTPHLALSWLLRSLGPAWKTEPFRELPVLPFVNHSHEGTLTTSHADWICPTHCVEPETCPHTKGPRFWDMADSARALAHRLSSGGQPVDQIHLFQCLHFTHGVGTYSAGSVRAAYEALAAQPEARALVGTVSRCHGAMHLLKGWGGTDTVSPRTLSAGFS
ncbi:MAG TPA: hypothetical protein VM100_06380 [Longimicrobiales bacterium]|nr:hypothetical protein [Longimicrobiales bacterium]